MRVHRLLEVKCVGLESVHGGGRVEANCFISCGEFGSVGFVYGGRVRGRWVGGFEGWVLAVGCGDPKD